jgi:hypothetical protein
VIRLAKKSGLQWTAGDLQAHIRQTYGAILGDDAAVNAVRFLGEDKRLDGVPGRPYYAHNRKAQAWAKRQYSGAQAPADVAD